MFSHLSLLYLRLLAGGEAERVMSKENKYYFILTRSDDASQHTLWIHFRELALIFGFSLMCRINGTEEDFSLHFSLSTRWIRCCWSSAIVCRPLRGKWCVPSGPTLLLKTVLEWGAGFMFVSPRAHNTFPRSSTDKQAKSRFAGRKALKGRCFLSPMKKRKFNVLKEVKLSDNRSRLSSARHVIVHKDRWGAANSLLLFESEA